jgi:hypothetical protein
MRAPDCGFLPGIGRTYLDPCLIARVVRLALVSGG